MQFPNRYRLQLVPGTDDIYDIIPAPGEVADEGTFLNKSTLLKDATAALFGLGADAVPDDALAAIKGLINSKSEVETGSYVGTGADTKSITFGITPKLVWIYVYKADTVDYIQSVGDYGCPILYGISPRARTRAGGHGHGHRGTQRPAGHGGGSMNRMQAAEQLRRALQMFAATLSEAQAMEVATVYPAWAAGLTYAAGDMLSYGTNGVGDPQLYKVVQGHTSQADWPPDITAALYTPIGLTAEGYPVWSQPTGAHDAYNTGDIVDYNGTLYRSLIDGNVYSPDAYPAGWEVAA